MSIKTVDFYGTSVSPFKADLSKRELNDIEFDESIKGIRVLDASANLLETLQFLTNFHELLSIDLSDNHISKELELFQSTPFLSSLSLSKNSLSSMSMFPSLECLTILNLSRNSLTTLKDLPDLPMLQTLDVSFNSIETSEMREYPSLKTLNISHNNLKRLSLPKLESIRELDCSSNEIEEIEHMDAGSFPYLYRINIESNRVSSISTIESMKELPFLFELKTQGNPLLEFQHILVIIPNLQSLNDKLVNAKDKVKAELQFQ